LKKAVPGTGIVFISDQTTRTPLLDRQAHPRVMVMCYLFPPNRTCPPVCLNCNQIFWSPPPARYIPLALPFLLTILWSQILPFFSLNSFRQTSRFVLPEVSFLLFFLASSFPILLFTTPPRVFFFSLQYDPLQLTDKKFFRFFFPVMEPGRPSFYSQRRETSVE